jgi:hypothetical protein
MTPSPDEIREKCAEIRAGWDEERWSREDDRVSWHIPIVRDRRGSGNVALQAR